MDQIIRIGMDTSKRFFQRHGVDAREQPVLRRQLKRDQVLPFFTRLPPTLVALALRQAQDEGVRGLASLGTRTRAARP